MEEARSLDGLRVPWTGAERTPEEEAAAEAARLELRAKNRVTTYTVVNGIMDDANAFPRRWFGPHGDEVRSLP